MKTRNFFFLALLLLGITAQAQTTKGLNFQAVARDNSGQLITNQSVNVTFSVLKGSDAGPVVYEEDASPTTNDYGLFTAVIGKGTVQSGTFSGINWENDDYFLKVELNGALVATTQFEGVPYAKTATAMALNHLTDVQGMPASGNALTFDGANWVPGYGALSLWDTSGNDVYYDQGDVGIGTNSPSTKLHLFDAGNSGDLRIEDNLPFIYLDMTGASGNAGVQYKVQGTTKAEHYYQASSDALLIKHITASSNYPNIAILPNGHVAMGEKTATRNLDVFGADSSYIRLVTRGDDEAGIEFLQPSTGSYLYRDWKWTTSGGDFILSVSEDNFGSNSVGVLYDYDAAPSFRNLRVDGAVRPTTDNTWDLGASSLRWDDVYATNGTINTSDAREKDNVQDLNYGLAALMQLHPVSFTWKDKPEKGTKLGLIAQELNQVIPEVVVEPETPATDEEGNIVNEGSLYGVYYSDLIPVLIKSIQEQQATIETLEQRILELESK